MTEESQGPTTALRSWACGDDRALDRAFSVLYRELRGLASAYLRREGPGRTLDTASLVHEAYLRLLPQRQGPWQSRTHFVAIAARMMRRVLVDAARARGLAKRGGDWRRVFLRDDAAVGAERPPDLESLDAALAKLEEREPDLAQIVELRFFGGLTESEVSTVLGVSRSTVGRNWRVARAWLFRELRGEAPADG